MDIQTPITDTPDPLDASFDIVARQDALEENVATIRTDLDEVKARVDKIGKAAQRPAIGGDSAPAEVKGFVDGYLRRGAVHEIKSISGTVPSDGGYAVPRQIDAMIARELTDISPIRAIAQVVQTGTAGYRKLISTGGTASGWASEIGERDETDTPTFAEIAPPTGDLYANPAASQSMLDDAAFYAANTLVSDRFLLTTAFNLHFTKPIRAGRARVEVRFVGEVVALDAEQTRLVAGRDADARAYLLLRPYRSKAVKVALRDPADPTPYWLVSSRRPEKVLAALRA